jgi:serine/threonine protein kinase
LLLKLAKFLSSAYNEEAIQHYLRCVVQDVYLTLPIGTVIRSRYVIEGLLGKGGYGSVYLVKDKRVKGNLFALKELVESSKQERDRFTFECEVLRRLDHPSLPHVYRTFSNDADLRAYMLMDFIDGPNLEVLRKQQPDNRFPLSQALIIMKPIMDALSYLHNQQPPIIHRDIKPANIIVPKSGDEAMLVDFGIAKEYEPDSTTTTVRRCSPGYGAPEQYSSGTNNRTDIYGLGATFYVLLSGIVPADAFNRMIRLGSKESDTLEPLTDLVPDLPTSVADAICRSMSINYHDRFASVEEFWQALSVHAGEPEEQEISRTVLNLSATATPSSIESEQKEQQESPASEPLVVASSTDSNNGVPDAEDVTIVAEQKLSTTQPPALPPQRQTAASQTARAWSSLSRSRKWSVVTIFIVLILLIGGSVATAFGIHYANQSGSGVTSRLQTATTHMTQTSTPRLSSSPTASRTHTSTPRQNGEYIAGIYNGSIFDSTIGQNKQVNVMIQQTRGSATISGTFTFKSPYQGSYPLKGSVDTHGNFSFTVQTTTNQPPLYFYGTVQSGIYLQGNFCSSSTNQCSADTGYFNIGPRF